MPSPFVKYNHSGYPDALLAEARGLELLRRALAGSELRVPQVLRADESQLEMTAIGRGAFGADQWAALGRGLADLHRARGESFGLDEDNYIGLNPQFNGVDHDWGRFFLQRRLLPQVQMIANSGVKHRFADVLKRCGEALAQWLNAHDPWPSPVHGDLWNGNVLCDAGGDVWLIDPAAHWADREVDIAMTEMFGGFGAAFYDAYRQALPLAAGYDQRRPIYNLY
ncbi:MAG: fructosamine kinase family protein, partial [Gammaproteobacteria bacterium]|nr:fructosamine kinase family protein [Gammaproteobacteria bacterium]NIT64572.1 fructosamine kinase family protein [Gammaproteobacteria bacterium]NIV21506.1 phosphotransferase [Gammaproteobacteria bacterium]NIY33152.1 phosphotransferase [Gammaproteobacteria bacterium]